MGHAGVRTTVAALGAALTLTACTQSGEPPETRPGDEPSSSETTGASSPTDDRRPVTLAFAGDAHFEFHLTRLFRNPGAGLGPIDDVLSDADVTVVNLETAITTAGPAGAQGARGPRQPLLLPHLTGRTRRPGGRRGRRGHRWPTTTPPTTAPSGPARHVAGRGEPHLVIGVGRNRREAFAPYRVTVRGTEIAVVAADAVAARGLRARVGRRPPTSPGPRPRASRGPARCSSRSAGRRDRPTWSWSSCTGAARRRLRDAGAADHGQARSRAGADVVVGSHAHRLLGVGLAPGRQLRQLRPRQLRLVPRPRARDRRPVSCSWRTARSSPTSGCRP